MKYYIFDRFQGQFMGFDGFLISDLSKAWYTETGRFDLYDDLLVLDEDEALIVDVINL